MKKIFTVLIVVFSTISVGLRAQEMSPGTNFLSLGIGPSYNYYHYDYYTGGIPAVKIALDHGFREAGPGTITLGGSLGFFTQFYKNYIYKGQSYTQHWTCLSAIFRAGYYYNFKRLKVPELNVYAGVGTGILQRFYSYNGPSTYDPLHQEGSGFIVAIYAGANYFLTKKFAFFTEFGYDISYVTIGMTFKL